MKPNPPQTPSVSSKQDCHLLQSKSESIIILTIQACVCRSSSDESDDPYRWKEERRILKESIASTSTTPHEHTGTCVYSVLEYCIFILVIDCLHFHFIDS